MKNRFEKTINEFGGLIAKTKLFLVYKFWSIVISLRFRATKYLNKLVNLLLILRRYIPIFIAVALSYLFINYTEVSSWNAENLASYLTSAGAMVGGVLAIVFSLTIFGQRSVLDIHTTKVLKPYVYGRIEKAIFLAITIITILFFLSGQYIVSTTTDPTPVFVVIIYLSFVALAVVFVLVELLYERVTGKVSSESIFNFLTDTARKYLRRLSKETELLSVAVIAEAKYKKQRISKQHALSNSRRILYKKFSSKLDEVMKVIYEVTVRLLSRNEYEPANNGLRAAHNVVYEYLKMIQHSSTSLPANTTSLGFAESIFARQSDSADFLNPNLDRIAKIGEAAIKSGNVQNIQLTTDVLKSLAFFAKDIKHPGVDRENQILNLIVGYQIQYLEFAITARSLEAVYQVAQSLKEFVKYAIMADSYLVQNQLQKDATKIAIFAIKENRSFVINECFNALIVNIFSLIGSQSTHKDILFRDLFNTVESLIETIFNAQKAGLYGDAFTVSHFFNQFLIQFPLALNVYETIEDNDKKTDFRDDLLEILEELRRSIRTLSEKIKNVDNPLVEVIGRTLLSMNQYMIQALSHSDFTEKKDKIENLLGWYIHQPPWFFHGAEKFEISNRNRSLIESTAQTGVLLFRDYYNERLLEACVDSLFNIVTETFKKNTSHYLYDEPRLMMRICYLGVLARKYNKAELYAHIRVKILEFESLYEKAYQKQLKGLPKDIDPEHDRIIGFPEKERLLKEMYEWRDDLLKSQYSDFATRLMDDAKSLMPEMVSVEDVDWFMFDVFGKFVADSTISPEVDLLIARSNLINTLIKIRKKKEEK